MFLNSKKNMDYLYFVRFKKNIYRYNYDIKIYGLNNIQEKIKCPVCKVQLRN